MARSKGDGGITRLEDKPKGKCRLWRVEANDPRGKRRFRRVHGTYAQAEAELKRLKTDISAPVRSYQAFGEYADAWLASRKAAPQTIDKERARIEALKMHLGGTALRDIRRIDVQSALNRIEAGENVSGRKLSGTTMNGMHQTLRQVLQDAVFDGLLESNPAANVKPPKKDTQPKRALSVDDVRRVMGGLDLMPLNGFTVGVRLAVLAGARRAEIVGFEWRDVEHGRLVVRRSVQCKTGDIKEPKTESGWRAIPMLPKLEADLARWRDVQRFKLASLGVEQGEDTPVVTSEAGTRLDASNLYRWWHKTGPRLLGVECTLHELRHTFLTMLANSGANVAAIKSIGGWSNIAMADVYVHTDEDADAEAVRMMGERVGGSLPKPDNGRFDTARKLPQTTVTGSEPFEFDDFSPRSRA